MSKNKEKFKRKIIAESFDKANLTGKNINSNYNSFIKSYISKPTNNKLYYSPITYNIKNNNDYRNHKIYLLTGNNLNEQKKMNENNILNSSSDLSNFNTQLNSNTKRTIPNIKGDDADNNKRRINYNLKELDSQNLKYFKKRTFFVNNNNFKNYFKKNTISYVDRKKLKRLNTSTLKLYEIYIQRKNQFLKTEESPEKTIDLYNQQNKNTDYYISDNLNNYRKNEKNISKNSSMNSFRGHSDNYKIKNLKKLSIDRKYCLKQLMNFNPYHYVSSMVKYCNSIEMKNISEKLSNVNGASFNRKSTSQQLFFKNGNNVKKNNKVINSVSVSMNNNLTIKGGLVWRILEKITKAGGYSSFYNACKFKGYYELWKHYSIIIEQLLVKYIEFKWFLEKNKYIQEDVFKEFLTCIKVKIKNDNSFPNKVFLLFDEDCLGQINIKIFLFIMELISKSSSDIEKIHFYSDLFCDIKLQDKIKCINVLEIFEIIKKIITSANYKKEIKILYEILKQEFNNGQKIENNLFISKKQLYCFFLNNKYIHKIIQSFKLQYKNANILYNEEINSSFNSTIRNVEKFLNEQNEIIKMSINECDNLENILKAIQEKGRIKNNIKVVENEFHNILNE